MRRLFWVGVGASVTVVAYRKGRKVVRQYLPSSIAERAEQAAHEVGERAGSVGKEFRAIFAEARTRRETELTAALLAEGQPDPAATRAARAAGPGPGGEDDAGLGYSF